MASSRAPAYQAPSNLKPNLAVLSIALIYPVILASNILTHPSGIQSLTLTRTLIFLVVEGVLLRYSTIPHFTTPLLALPRPSNERTYRGNARELLHRPQVYNFTDWTRNTPNDGLIFVRGFLHFSWHVMVTSPAALTEILSTKAYEFEKPPPARKFLLRVLGDGLIVSEGAAHKRQRKQVAPAFAGKHVRELVPLFWAKAGQMVETIVSGKMPHGKVFSRVEGKMQAEVEIGSLASRATLDIIGKAAFGRDFNTLDNNDDELARQYETILDPKRGLLILYFAINVLLPQWFASRLPWKMNKRINEATKNLRTICRQLINDKKDALRQEKEQGLQGSAEIDILSVLLRNNELDEVGLVNQMLTFLAAGHETTSSALTWTCYLLSAHPKIQSRLRAELLASPLVTDPSADLLDSLPLLQAVCSESLRFYPTVPVTARSALRDVVIQGQLIPAGVEMIICPWTTNRDKELWGADADEFNPDRWMKGDGTAKTNTYDFITFLHGPRSCIGQGFARWELACLLARLVMRFEMKLAEGWEGEPEPAGAVTIKPRDGIRLVLNEVQG